MEENKNENNQTIQKDLTIDEKPAEKPAEKQTKQEEVKKTEEFDKKQEAFEIAKDFYKDRYKDNKEFNNFLLELDNFNSKSKSEIFIEMLKKKCKEIEENQNKNKEEEGNKNKEEDNKVVFEKNKEEFIKKYGNEQIYKNLNFKRKDKEFNLIYDVLEKGVGHETAYLFFKKNLNDNFKGTYYPNTATTTGESSKQEKKSFYKTMFGNL